MSAGERDEQIFLYAAGALEGEERDEVEAWLARGEGDTLERLARSEAEVAQLGLAVRPLAPPEAVRERLRRRIAAAGGPAAGGGAPVVDGWLRSALAAGVAVLLAAGLGAWLGQHVAERRLAPALAELRTKVDTLTHDLAETRTELAAAREERDALDRDLGSQEAATRALQGDLLMAHKAINVLAAEHMESLRLHAAGGGDARARVFWDWDDWYCYLRAEGLPDDGPGVYALWLFTDSGEVIGLGPFEADPNGSATLLTPVPHDIGHVVRAGVSLEPDGDLGPEPRGPVLLVGKAT